MKHTCGVWSDLRLACRSLRKTPVFATTVILLVIFSVAASTTIFTLISALLLRPLPVRDPDRLVHLVTVRPPLPPDGEFHSRHYEAWQRHVPELEDAIAWSEHDLFVRANNEAERARVHFVSDNFFTALAAGPAVGRLLVPDDQQATSGMAPVVLSHAYWSRRFSEDSKIVGQVLEINGHKVVIAGVAAKGFNGLTAETGPDVRMPIGWLRRIRSDLNENEISYQVVARLRRGVAVEPVRQKAEAVWRRTSSQWSLPDSGVAGRLQLESAARGISRLRPQFSGTLWLLLSGMMLLVLLVNTNVASLMITRATNHAGELAVRIALGASRLRLIRQLLCESLLLALAGIAGAFAVCLTIRPALPLLLPPLRDMRAIRLPLSLDLAPDWRVFLFGLAVATSAVVIFGVLPAISATRLDVHPLLKQTRASGSVRGREAMLAVQAALSTVLLITAGLTSVTLHRLETQAAGFERSHIVTFSLDPAMANYTPEQTTELQRRLVSRALTLPDVVSGAIAIRGLMRGTGIKTTIARAGESVLPGEFMNTSVQAVSPGYFAAMGIAWRAGRNFKIEESRSTVPRPVIVNETFARRFGGERAVLGGRFGSVRVNGPPAQPAIQVIGIVADAKYRSLREQFQPIVYELPLPGDAFLLHLRTRSAPEAVLEPMRIILSELDPRLSWMEVSLLESEVAASLWAERAGASVASLLAGVGVLIVAIGLYGLVALSAIQRHREIGIRLAVGASFRDILGLLLSRAVILAIAGIAAGVVLARVTAVRMTGLLYEVKPDDSTVTLSAAALVLAVSALAAVLPAFRAIRQPLAALLREP